MVSYLKNHAEEFAELLAQKTTKDYERESRNRRQHLQELIARNKEVDRLFERIYEDNVSGKLTDERFMKMSQRYDEEQQQLKKDIEELQRQCDRENDRAFCKEQFLKAVRKFMEMKTLTPTILHELVERIDVYQTQGRGKNRTQRIVIHYNFIGVLDLPEVEEYPDTESSSTPLPPASSRWQQTPGPTPNRQGQLEAYRTVIRENISYDILLRDYGCDRELLDGCVEMMAEVCASAKETIRVNQEDMPVELVRSRFLKLDMTHIAYVLDYLSQNATPVGNIRGYMLSMLYNAPMTMGQYYAAQVNCDIARRREAGA